LAAGESRKRIGRRSWKVDRRRKLEIDTKAGRKVDRRRKLEIGRKAEPGIGRRRKSQIRSKAGLEGWQPVKAGG
jgi:hypothetical protein